MDNAELKPCPNPWCEENKVQWYLGASGRYAVQCRCGICGPWSDTKDKAISAWNTRADDARLRSTGELREAIEAQRRQWFCSGHDCEPFDHGRDEGFELALKAFDEARAKPASTPAVPEQGDAIRK